MIKPSVGRVLWYYRNDDDDEDDAQPWAAIIARVHDDRRVNLMIIDNLGQSASRVCVRLLQDDDAAPANTAYCVWMPFQVRQAKQLTGATGQTG